MSDTNPMLRRNKSKTTFKWLFILFVLCLVIYFWKFVNQTLNQNIYEIIFCFLFLIGSSVILGWRMQKEPDFELDPKKTDVVAEEETMDTEKKE